ncbi:MAG: hypothetical protein LBC97_07540 [Bifidobacteriaceae bacterium]|jgi:hypothetical protein|nr:hypothetical protein [Bifidobacteriaceae bacterium]
MLAWLKDKGRVVDFMLSAHAALRDRYSRLATASVCVILALSAISAALAFAPGNPRLAALLWVRDLDLPLIALATLVFVLSLLDLVFDFRGRAAKHAEASRQLAALKHDFATAGHASEALLLRYSMVTSSIAPIPERQFLRLKEKHLFKIEVSKTLSRVHGITLRRARKLVRARGRNLLDDD